MHVIKREAVKKETEFIFQTIERHKHYQNFQISFNSWGHITIRGFNSQIKPDDTENQYLDDILIILSVKEVQELVCFLKKIFKEI